MNAKKIVFDLIFIVITAVVLIVLNGYGIIEKYSAYLLIPLMIAYFLGKFVERKTGTKSER